MRARGLGIALRHPVQEGAHPRCPTDAQGVEQADRRRFVDDHPLRALVRRMT
jgi:hypothetical protein